MSLVGSDPFYFTSLLNEEQINSDAIVYTGLTTNTVIGYDGTTLTSNITTDGLTEGFSNLYFTTARSRAAISAGTGIAYDSGTGIISNSGVTTLTGTANRITVSGSTGNITLNLPQDINTTSYVQFAGLTLGTLSGVLKATAGVVAASATTDDLTEGKTNLYFTNNRARAAFTASAPIFITSGVVSLGYNTTNLKLTGSNLDTIQDIDTTSSVQFARLLSSTVGNRTVLLGTNTGNSFTTGGTDCVAVGHNTLTSLTTAGTSTAVGSQALRHATTGGSNTAVGFNALHTLTTGNQNTALGGYAGGLITTGRFNTLMGLSAGYNITSGDTNFCLGLNAGYSITSSHDNISIGAYSMAKNLNSITVTNGRNIAIGHYASHSLEGSPANNISIGYNAMYNATSPSDNVILGTNAGNSISTSGGNIAIGGGSLSTGFAPLSGNGRNTTIGVGAGLYLAGNAQYNIMVGEYAGFNNSTSSSNIYLGRYTQGSSSVVANEIVISTKGDSSAPITGRGANTAFIDARSGLYYYIPGYWWGYAQNQMGGILRWNTFINRAIILNPADSTQILCPTPGLYEFNLSGSIYNNVSAVQTLSMFVNGIKYLANPCYYFNNGGNTGWQAISLSAFVYVNNTTTYIQYDMTANLLTDGNAPTILTAKYCGL